MFVKAAGKRKKAIIAVILAAVVALTGIFVIYPVITEKIIDVSMINLGELASRSERVMKAALEGKWDTLRGIAEHIGHMGSSSSGDLAARLDNSKQLMNCTRIIVIDEDGNTVSSDMTASTVGDDEISGVDLSADRYVYCTESRHGAAGEVREILVLGTKIDEPFTVDGHRYTDIAATVEPDNFLNEVETEIYGGKGKDFIVDRNGRYIVNANNDYASNGGFFAYLRSGSLNDITADGVKEKMAAGETFSVIFTGGEGAKVLCFVPVSEMDWYFIMSVPRSVFEEQSISLITIFLSMLILLQAAVFAIIITVLHMEMRHRRELSEALVVAERASRAKTTFLNNMSHDIRTPMNAIIGFTALATEHIDETARVKDYLGKITQSSNHLLSLINDVLDMSRIEAGSVTIEEEPENLSEILHTVKNIVQGDIHSKNLDFSVETNISDENIICDKLRLNRVLLNLLSNAIKFTPPGGSITLEVKQTDFGENAAAYEFTVSDNGIGMSKEFAEVVFEPFTRAQSSSISGIQGTGLGMSITKNYVELMGGTISVESRENKGTRFTVQLSFKLYNEKKPEDSRADTKESLARIRGRRLLLAEDNELNREIATGILEDAGLRVECAENGKIAVEMLEGSEPGYYAAVLMDIQMPVMDGYDASRAIRLLEDRTLSEIPIIAMTANAFDEDRQAAYEAGINAHVGKPISVDVLFETILEYVK